MAALLAILSAGRNELDPKPRRLIPIILASLALAIGMAAREPAAAYANGPQTSISPPGRSAASRPDSEPFPAPLDLPYPDASDPVALGRWFAQTTHLPATSVLAITDNAIFAAFPQHTSGSLWTVDVRLESITPQSTAKLGGRSIRLRLNVRCEDNTVRLDFLDAYPGADLTGAPTHRAPKNDWALPKPNSYVADAVRLACDKTFKGPFAAIAAHASAARPDLKTVVKSVPEAMSSERGPALRPREPLAAAYAVQIGAYSTPRGSDEAWRALQSALPDKTHGLSKATTPVRADGRTLYRTVVKGFASIEAAAAFCRVLQTSGRPCLIVGAGGP